MSLNDVITLNVGGVMLTTKRETLTKYPESKLAKMFDAESPVLSSLPMQKDGSFFIDRDPETFKIILNYLRSGRLNSQISKMVREDLKIEAQYFGLKDLEQRIYKRF
eukprot:TRINITY_DN15108_c0_g1_i4.p1 TRINITY_DN15108_c0_g1~~TRINITY_DN15108_c0_g1_i4.p1  ORF type:complete len:107 (-),score=16.31 TRINITY_DN15108_c0_g1_i4:224-544(-)